MGKRVGTIKTKTRHKLRKTLRTKGKISISKFFQEFQVGDKVQLSVEPAYHNGMYYLKYLGKRAIVQGKKGRCFEVTINDKGKEKMLIVHPIHLKRV